jgi:hypothetical protein
VAQGLSDFEAKVVTARLGADGILWELRGIVDGVYPLGGIDVLVPVDELAAARVSLRDGPPLPVATEEDAGLAPSADAGPSAGVDGDDGDRDEDDGHRDEDDGDRDTAADQETPGGGAGRRRWLTVMVVAGVAAFALARLASGLILYDVRTDCRGDSFRAAAEGLTVRCRP